MTMTTPETGIRTPEEREQMRQKVYNAPLESLDPGDPGGFESGEMWLKFERLRSEDPVHFTPGDQTVYGPYWSVTRWDDIVAIDSNHEVFSNEASIMLRRPRGADEEVNLPFADGGNLSEEEIKQYEERGLQSLLSMDPPDHEVHRNAVSMGVSPARLTSIEPLIRVRAGQILDGLPIGEEFDWLDQVSMELTAMTLATLFDFPQADRRKLTYWSDVAVCTPGPGQIVQTREEQMDVLREFFTSLAGMFMERAGKDPQPDFLSLMAHSPHAKEFTPAELFGDIAVLLVGGNDTTRNTISGSVYALNTRPEEYDKLRADHSLIPSMVSETIRWQTPLAHMMRKTTRDVEVAGKLIPEGDRLALWYVSGNRDETKIDRPNDYIIDRKNARRHMSFGFGIHRCLGNRLAEMQLKIIWEEILQRFPDIQVLRPPRLSYNSFAKGYEDLHVIIPRRS